MVEDEIRLVLYKYSSNFIFYELEPGNYNFRDLSESVFIILQPEYLASSTVNVIEVYDITIKIKLIVRDDIIAISFDEKSFFNTVLGFT